MRVLSAHPALLTRLGIALGLEAPLEYPGLRTNDMQNVVEFGVHGRFYWLVTFDHSSCSSSQLELGQRTLEYSVYIEPQAVEIEEEHIAEDNAIRRGCSWSRWNDGVFYSVRGQTF